MSAMTASIGFASGSTIDHSTRRSLAPSISAASTSSFGIEYRKYVRAMMTCHTPTACGSSSAHRVSSIPSDCTTR